MNLQQNILGALMLSPSAWDTAGHRLTVACFSGHEADIFRAIESLATDGKSVDAVSVTDWLDTRKRLHDGGDYINNILNQTVSAAGVSDHADMLLDRMLNNRVDALAVAIHDTKGTGQERASESQSLVASIESVAGSEPQRLDMGAWLEIMQERAEGVTGLLTGFVDIDRRLQGLRGGDLFVLAGRPSMGKSALATQIQLNVSNAGMTTAMFNLEMSAVSLIDRIVSLWSKTPMGNIRSKCTDDEWTRIT